jgi:hypothetical protein
VPWEKSIGIAVFAEKMADLGGYLRTKIVRAPPP